MANRVSDRALRGVCGLVAVFVMLLLTGCQADFTATVDIEEDGSGVVQVTAILDRAATDALIDISADGLKLSDLAQAGWEVELPEERNGGTVFRAQKAFGNEAQFSEVMDELTGPDGVFRDFDLVIEPTFGRLDYTVTGSLNPAAGFESFGDEELDSALGRSLSDLAADERFQVSESDFNFTLNVLLPGDLPDGLSTPNVEASEDQEQVQGQWMTNLADEEPVPISVSTTRRKASAQVLRGVAVVAGVLAALIAFGQILRVIASSQRKKPAAKSKQIVDAMGAPVAPAAELGPQGQAIAVDGQAEEHAADLGHRVVALDGMGVLYREGNDIGELLVPFARHYGSSATTEDIREKAHRLTLGRMSTAEFWQSIGVAGDPDALDSAYIAGHQLMPGVVKYLRGLRDRGVRVACVTNDSATWAMKLRASHSLEGLIDPWVVSGSVGVRKPDAPVYEVLRRVTGEPPEAILVIDDDLDVLDAARQLGFATRWFNEEGTREEARGHEVWRRFDIVDEEPTPETPPPVSQS